MRRSIVLAVAAVVLAAGSAGAQATIRPGMTSDQVRATFGAPATARAAGDWTYWYYHNGCPVRCGSDDVVFFQNDRVVAAVLRTARRRFAGPAADEALSRAEGRATGVDSEQRVNDAPAGEGPARVGGVRVEGAQPSGEVIITPSRTDEADRDRPQAREGRPGEPSTIVISTPENAEAATVVTPVRSDPAPAPAGREAGALGNVIADEPAPARNPPAVDNPLPTGAPERTGRDATPLGNILGDDEPAPAENTEAADTRGQTSIDRKHERNVRDRQNEMTATERARRNDRPRNP
ncbi:MAG TPA: outer membrane protein assembly factor BamE [Longimicrobium sp.]|nr:outer membrane protein assembly factor BamE [Longimicrobium sp.]